MALVKFKLYDGRDPRNIPAYTLPEVSRYIGVPIDTLRNWTDGRHYKRSVGVAFSEPLIVRPVESESLLSFTNLIEVHVLGAIRRTHKVSMGQVRKSLAYLSKQFKSEHPLAEYDFETDGIDLFIKESGLFLNVSKGGQIAIETTLRAYLKRIERDEQRIAQKLFPFTRSAVDLNDDPKIVAINPRVSFGKPVIHGTGIATAIVAERYKLGESISELSEDYGLEIIQIEEAIRCELDLQAA